MEIEMLIDIQGAVWMLRRPPRPSVDLGTAGTYGLRFVVEGQQVGGFRPARCLGLSALLPSRIRNSSSELPWRGEFGPWSPAGRGGWGGAERPGWPFQPTPNPTGKEVFLSGGPASGPPGAGEPSHLLPNCPVRTDETACL